MGTSQSHQHPAGVLLPAAHGKGHTMSTSKAPANTHPATHGSIAAYRVHVRDIAAKLGLKVVQVSTETDKYLTKDGSEKAVSVWGSSQLITVLVGGQSALKGTTSKLQQLVTILGLPMGKDVLFKSAACPAPAKLPTSKLPALQARAIREVKVIPTKS